MLTSFMIRGSCWIAFLASAVIAQSAAIDDIAPQLFAASVWQQGNLPGTWVDLPREPTRQGREMKPVGRLWGVQPAQIRAWYDRAKLTRIDVLVAAGGSPEAPAAMGEMISALVKFSGKPGRIGNVAAPARQLDFDTESTLFRLMSDANGRVTLMAVPAPSAAKPAATVSAATPTTPESAVKKLAERVEKLPNGDAIIRHLPTPPMEGDAEYIGLQHVLLLQMLYGWPGELNKLLRKMGWTPNDDTFDWYKYYEAVPKEAKTRMEKFDKFNLDEVSRAIARGHPVIVWDATEEVRMNYHADFAKKFAADPKLELPSARDAEEQKKWPKYQSESNSGAMLIIGVNKRRGEIIFLRQEYPGTELRMRKEEIEFTAGSVFIFQP